MKFNLESKNVTRRLFSSVPAILVMISTTLSFAAPVSAGFNGSPAGGSAPTKGSVPTKGGGGVISGIAAGVQLFDEVVRIYQQLNPAQEGYVKVLNASNETVTVRSYNNNDWAKLVAAGQIVLQPGASANITAATDPVALVWKRGNYGTLKPFGTVNLSQSVAPKGPQHVFVITEDNTL